MRFHSLEKLINLQPGYRRQFKIDNLHLLLLYSGDELVLLESLCPHAGHSLLNAELHGDTIECPRHGYRFRLSDGLLTRATEQPCRNLRCYQLIYRGNEVGIVL